MSCYLGPGLANGSSVTGWFVDDRVNFSVLATPQNPGHASLNFPTAVCVSTGRGKYSLPSIFPSGGIQDELHEDAGALILVKFPNGGAWCIPGKVPSHGGCLRARRISWPLPGWLRLDRQVEIPKCEPTVFSLSNNTTAGQGASYSPFPPCNPIITP